jgi:uncharacterized protein YqjF (DUF2071 family)
MRNKIKSFDDHVFESSTEDLLYRGSPYRSWKIPEEDWAYYQEWNKSVFMHWEVDYNDLQELVPAGLELDSFDGKYWVSIVAFTMEKIRPAYLPPFAPISNFDEINVRTYVIRDGKPGVYFINIEAGKYLSAFLSRMLSSLPYEKSQISRGDDFYRSNNPNKGFRLDLDYEIGPTISRKSPLDLWLTERYALYLEKDGGIYGYEIQHQEWDLKEVQIDNLEIYYSIGNLIFDSKPDLCQYSPGVKVLAWGMERL